MMIATGTGTPLHWLAEGTDYNRAVGQLMDEPAKKRLEHRQQIAKYILTSLIDRAIFNARAAGTLPGSHRGYRLELTFPDLTVNDLLSQAQAFEAAAAALEKAKLAGLFDDPTYRLYLEHFAQMLPTVGTATNIADPDVEQYAPTETQQ
jgi:hypothetical protein